MELKAGYKQTEVGVIPIDWEVKSLGDIGAFKNGINKSFEDFGFGFPFANLMDVFGKSSIVSNKNFGLINSNDFERKLYNLQEGDVLFIRSSVKPTGVGLTCVIENNLIDTVFSGFIIRFRNNGYLSKEFKRHCFYSERFRNSIIGSSTVSANTNINQDSLKKLLIPIPPSLKEQTVIATVLSDTDAWITSLEQLIAKKSLLKQGVMQQLLQPKEGWEVKKLGDVCDVIIGLTYSPNDVRDHGTLVLRSSNIQNNKLAFENNVFVEMDLPQRVIVKEKDILICVRNGSKKLIGKCALIDKKTEGQAFGAFMAIIRSDLNKYIYYYFLSNHIQIQIDENMGATINQLTNATLKSFEIHMPNKQEQTRIANILSDMDAEITVLETKLEKAKKIKLGMMQELLTGKIRLV